MRTIITDVSLRMLRQVPNEADFKRNKKTIIIIITQYPR